MKKNSEKDIAKSFDMTGKPERTKLPPKRVGYSKEERGTPTPSRTPLPPKGK